MTLRRQDPVCDVRSAPGDSGLSELGGLIEARVSIWLRRRAPRQHEPCDSLMVITRSLRCQ